VYNARAIFTPHSTCLLLPKQYSSWFLLQATHETLLCWLQPSPYHSDRRAEKSTGGPGAPYKCLSEHRILKLGLATSSSFARDVHTLYFSNNRQSARTCDNPTERHTRTNTRNNMNPLSCCGPDKSDSAGRIGPSEEETVFYSARRIVTMNPSRPEGKVLAVRNGKVLAVGNSVQELHLWITDGSRTLKYVRKSLRES
jgi:hypothetical protein